jgi:hypothetical protein
MKLTAVRISTLLAVIAAAAPAAARAQSDTAATAPPAPAAPAPVATADAATRPLSVGDAVRLTAADRQYAGTIRRLTPDTLVLVAPNRQFTLQRAGVSSAEREVNSESRGHAMLRGGKYGFLGGAALGLLGGMLFTSDPAGRAFITADGVFLGSLVGGIMGVKSRESHWEPVDASNGARAADLPPPAPVTAGTTGSPR